MSGNPIFSDPSGATGPFQSEAPDLSPKTVIENGNIITVMGADGVHTYVKTGNLVTKIG
ncbi:MAG: hypothetical protein LBN10_12410 [Propionibacteriaceae bacterium]|jgi:hypothetical protein|nr:hypothetical protein [Propionibacteriaceae bacterium]